MSCAVKFEEHKPALAMVLVQFIFTFGTLAAKSLFSHGTSPMVFITYRQAVAMLVMLPTALLLRGPRKMALGLRAFTLVFAASLIGCTLNQYLYYQGLKMTSSSMGSAMNNLIPAVTFLMAASFGLEKVKLRSTRSMAKILGTVVCVGGAVFMAFYKGPKLLNMNVEFHTLSPILHSFSDRWMVGFIFLTGATCCGSLWLILQVPICKYYLDTLSLATWMCIKTRITINCCVYPIAKRGEWERQFRSGCNRSEAAIEAIEAWRAAATSRSSSMSCLARRGAALPPCLSQVFFMSRLARLWSCPSSLSSFYLLRIAGLRQQDEEAAYHHRLPRPPPRLFPPPHPPPSAPSPIAAPPHPPPHIPSSVPSSILRPAFLEGIDPQRS